MNVIAAIGLLLTCAGLACGQPLVNFSHLDHLTERVVVEGDSVNVVHVYANYPSYAWTDAKESGPEGIACVDDAARAAVMYCRCNEIHHDMRSLAAAKPLLRFVMKMEAPDGSFYNFIKGDHTINRDGKTSFRSFGWWAARGVWAMAAGSRAFRVSDPVFADSLRERVKLTFPHIDSLFAKYGKSRLQRGLKIPQWLLYESGADVTSELLLGLLEYERGGSDPAVEGRIRKLLEGIMVMQNGSMKEAPYGLHRSWETMWHSWGNGQTEALAIAGKLLHDKKFVASAEAEARGFYSRLLLDGYLKEMDVSKHSSASRYEQIAYGIRPMAVGLLRLYDATGNRVYLAMAGLSASWFFGNNVLKAPMYDPSTGRCFDGITDSARLNRNSGAESTIEALMTLADVEHYPDAQKYLRYHLLRTETAGQYHFGVFHNDSTDSEVVLGIDLKKNSVFFLEGKEALQFRMRNEVP